MKMKRPFHPILFAAFPVLSFFAANLDIASVSDLWRPLLVVVSVAATIWLVAYRITKDASRSAIGVTIFLALAFTVAFFQDELAALAGGRHHLLVSVPAAVIGAVWLARKARVGRWRVAGGVGLAFALFVVFDVGVRSLPLHVEDVAQAAWVLWAAVSGVLGSRIKAGVEPATVLLNWVGVLLVVQPIVGAGIHGFNSGREARRALLEAGPSPVVRPADGLPDIYYIILDGYGRKDALAEYYGLPDDPLAAGLEERGFYIARASRSNYTFTMQSLGSSLNMDYLHALIDVDPGEQSKDALRRLTDRNKVVELLRAGGYRYVSIVTYSSLLSTESADVVLEDRHGKSLLEEALMTRVPFARSLQSTGESNDHRLRVLSAFRSLDGLQVSSQPTFVLVHIISPHPPFVFQRDGGPTESITRHADGSHFMEAGGTFDEYVAGYREQVQYIAKRTLQSIDKLLARSGLRPIVIVQGDHGPRARLEWESFEQTEFGECLPILNAFLVPEEMESELYDSISPVNTFRITLNHLLGTEYEPLPDRSYYSRWSQPYVYTEVPGE